MAPSCVWMLALCACVALTFGADCGKDCAVCLYNLAGHGDQATDQGCSRECGPVMDVEKLLLCRKMLLGLMKRSRRSPEVVPPSPPQVLSCAHGVGGHCRLQPRYGGFMGRVGSPDLGGKRNGGE